MHSIKRAARKTAWFADEDDEFSKFNPWGRFREKPKPREIEDGLQNTFSADDVVSPAEARRRADNIDSVKDFAGPTKGSTFPPATRDAPRASEKSDPSSGGGTSGNMDEKTDSISADEPEMSRELSKPAPPQNGEHQLKHRKMGGILGKMGMGKEKHEDDGEELDRSRSSASKKDLGKGITVTSMLKAVFFSWINLLLVFVPVGIAVEYAGVNKVLVFVLNFIAIVPLAAMLSYATEELAMYIGETLGGLLNATFGNAVELIVGIIALNQKKILIVQTSLIGSMLSNLLLVMGMCFFFGGLKRTEQFFNITVAQTAASLLALAIGSLIIPTTFSYFSGNSKSITPVSRGTAVLLLVTYACYLIFQLRTHVDMYNEPSKKSPKKPSKRKEAGESKRGIAAIGAGSGAAMAGGEINQQPMFQDDDTNQEVEETPQLTRVGALVTLAGSTVLIALCAEFMVGAINAVSKSVSQEFIGLILLPIVGNAAEHATAVTVAIKDKMDLAIGVAVGSSLQIALLVLPLMVLLNWFGLGKGAEMPMTLSFDGFLVAVLFIAIIVVNYLIQDGKSHWLEGVLLQITYLIIAISAWFYPVKGDVAG